MLGRKERLMRYVTEVTFLVHSCAAFFLAARYESVRPGNKRDSTGLLRIAEMALSHGRTHTRSLAYSHMQASLHYSI